MASGCCEPPYAFVYDLPLDMIPRCPECNRRCRRLKGYDSTWHGPVCNNNQCGKWWQLDHDCRRFVGMKED